MTDINSIITKLVNSASSSNNGAKAYVTPTQTTTIPTPTVPVTDSLRLVKNGSASQGWQCPVCGAVMSPWTSVCVNFHGNWSYAPKVTFDNWQVTCTGSDQVSCGQTTTTTTSHI